MADRNTGEAAGRGASGHTGENEGNRGRHRDALRIACLWAQIRSLLAPLRRDPAYWAWHHLLLSRGEIQVREMTLPACAWTGSALRSDGMRIRAPLVVE